MPCCCAHTLRTANSPAYAKGEGFGDSLLIEVPEGGMDMLFYEDEIRKVSKIVGPDGWSTMRLQDPRVNGQLRKDQMTREAEAKNVAHRRKRLLNGYDW